jgi:hypothetical protein
MTTKLTVIPPSDTDWNDTERLKIGDDTELSTQYEFNASAALVILKRDGDNGRSIYFDTRSSDVVKDLDDVIALITRLRDKIVDAEGGWWRLAEEKKTE